ncbi:MAG: signal peptidase II [Methylobacterium sp.]|nr:MAG: signal peptidase II [Methylobacterium sp.]
MEGARVSEAAPQTEPGRFLRLGLTVAILLLLADQASKLWLIFGTNLRLTWPWHITPFLDFTVVWNRGISYGLFQQETEAGRWILTGIKLVAAVVLFFWLKRAENRLEAAGIGLIIGGAIGNAIDRIWHGAVFDFVHFHVGSFSWYVFNVADAAIVVGVVMMVASPLLLLGKKGDAS